MFNSEISQKYLAMEPSLYVSALSLSNQCFMQKVLGSTILAGKYEKEKDGRDEKDSTIYLVLCVMIYT